MTKFKKIAEVLRNSLGAPKELHRVSPLAHCDTALEVLIATILTQATSDQNALRAWLNLKKTFPGLKDMAESTEEMLFDTIKCAGLAEQKSKTILGVLKAIKEQSGSYSLEIFKDNPEGAWEFLNRLAGVGPKTAACTLLFGLGMPHFPVDVHIYRIVRRLGWYSGKISPAEVQERLKHEVPSEIQAELHILLLNLGPQFCRPNRPSCSNCPVQAECKKIFS